MRGRRSFDWKDLGRTWLLPLSVLLVATVILLGVTFLADFWVLHAGEPPEGVDPGVLERNPLELLVYYDLETLQNALGNLAQTIAAVLGIVITVVAIVVQLAATRYTPRVTELFFKEKTNFFVLGFFVVSGIAAIWISLSVGHGFLPWISVFVAVVVVTLSLLLMVPYFLYVFSFLDPENVIRRIRDNAVHVSLSPRGDTRAAKVQVLNAIEQLGDIALAAVFQKDKIISARAVDALRDLVIAYLQGKSEQSSEWFEIGPILRQKNPDFVSMHPDAIADLQRDRLWLEWKVLRQFQTIYNEALSANADMNYLLAIDTRLMGEEAIRQGFLPVTALSVKFFNTYMRATLNQKQVRTAYNLMHQYRQFAEEMIHAGRDGLVAELAGYFCYYGQVAHGMGLGFITETIAYDLAALCEAAHKKSSELHTELLDALLELDKEAETEAQEATLRGVRKAQVRLAAFYLQRGDEGLARRIFKDMENEKAHRLASIYEELKRIKTKDFWEVIDRGANFDYMDEDRKGHLDRFFSWFPDLNLEALRGAQRETARQTPPPRLSADSARATGIQRVKTEDGEDALVEEESTERVGSPADVGSPEDAGSPVEEAREDEA